MIKTIIFLTSFILFASACSDYENATPEKKDSGDHVWTDQTQALDKAKEVEGLLLDSAAEQRKIIDQQAQ